MHLPCSELNKTPFPGHLFVDLIVARLQSVRFSSTSYSQGITIGYRLQIFTVMRQATLSDGSLRPSMQELRHRFRTVEWEIEDVVTVVPPVDMMNITGTEEDVETAINRYYANSW